MQKERNFAASMEAELRFLTKILQNYRIGVHVIDCGNYKEANLDCGLRHYLHLSDQYDKLFHPDFKELDIAEYAVNIVKDIFLCTYLYLILPGKKRQVLIVGPYTSININKQMLTDVPDHFHFTQELVSQLEKYYSAIPYMPEDAFLLTLVNTFAEIIWQGSENYTVRTVAMTSDKDAALLFPLKPDENDSELSVNALESRYFMENKLIDAVSAGSFYKAMQIIGGGTTDIRLEERVSEPVRNIKNYLIIFNTLLRKAAEKGRVHPIYIDKVSSDFARRIETLGRVEDSKNLIREMLSAYCSLVNEHALQQYSPFVQKVIIRIDADLSADLSLNTLAQALNTNASYLSTLFKREMGKTLTEYVTQKRMEKAAVYLKNTNLQIQAIAQQCGIWDVNYFARLFKRAYQKTPKEYRAQNAK